jgi:anthranilate phosphoribosyltransferase
MVSQILENLSRRQDMDEEQAFKAMTAIMNGEWTPVQIGSFLMALKMKGETINEISGFVKAMRAKATKIKSPENVVDTCGTGGDGLHSFNISTAAAIVASAAGVPIAKHGNKSVSSKCGSADVLAALGVKIDLAPEQAEECLNSIDLAFLFAPLYHASMKHAVTPRREMGIRTVFNILGPMANPANAKRQLIGAFNPETAKKMIEVLKMNGSDHVLLVHSEDGMDEISLSSETLVCELRDGEIQNYKISPETFGVQPVPQDAVLGGDPSDNAQLLRNIFDNQDGANTEITAINAGATIYVAGKTGSLQEGYFVAKDAIASGKAKRKLQELIDFSNDIAVR